MDGPAHINGIESKWALLKRGYMETFHWMSEKQRQLYLNEFAHRRYIGAFNGVETLGQTIDGIIGERLPYSELVRVDG